MFRETKLLQAALTGDRQAFEKIIEKYQGMICAITLCGTGRLDVSEDLAQETFLKAWENLRQLRELRNFRSWLCSIARNSLQNYYRQKRPAPLDDTDIDASVGEDLQEPSEILIQQETHLLLEQAIMRLPEKYRAPLVMYYRQDQSIRQSSQALDLSATTIKTRLHRARLMLKEDLACRLETALKETGPRKTFTKAVMATLSAVPLGVSTTTEAAGIVAGSSMVLFTGVGLKIAAVAAVVALGVLTYSQWSNRDTSSSGWQSGEAIKTVTDPTPGSSNAESHSNPVRMDAAISDREAVAVQPVRDAKSTTVIPQVPLPLAPEQAVDENYTFTPKGVLCGLVTDIRTGASVSGARVYIPNFPRHEAWTDEHGFYSIDSVPQNGKYRIYISSKEYLGFGHGEPSKTFRIRKDECKVEHFSLTRGCRVEVSVADEQGEAVGDVRLSVVWMGQDSKRRDLGKDQTKPNGRATLGAIRASEIPYQLTSQHSDYASSATTIVLDDPNKVEHLTLVMKKGISIDGFIEYADGVPAEDVTVHAVPSGWLSREPMLESPVDANGGFSLHQVAAGQYSIKVSIPTGGPLGASFEHSVMERMLPLPAGDLLSLKLEENSPLFEADEGKQTTRSSRRRVRDEIPTETVSEEMPLIQGEVVAIGDQTPVKDFKIRLHKVRTLDGIYATPKDEWRSCKNGYFEVKTVGHGVYRVQVEAAGYAGTLSTEIDTHIEHYASIQLSRGGTIRGRVVGGDGSPLAKASVIPLSAAGGNRPENFDRFVCERGAVKTQEDGSFVMTHMPIGMETLKVIHSAHASRIVQDIVVREGEVTEEVTVRLPEGGRIEGFVYDDEGRPEANVILSFKDSRTGRPSSAGHFGMTVTDVNGYYAMNALPVDEVCYVERYQSMGASPMHAVIPIEGHTTQVNFGGRKIRVEGSIVVNGIPFANTQVVLLVSGQGAFGSMSHMTMANAQGRFVFRGVLPGRYFVGYQKESGGRRWQKAAVFNLADDPVSLGDIPNRLATLEVLVTGNNTDPTQWEVRYKEGLQHWKAAVGNVTAPSRPGDPHIIHDVLPGVGRVSVKPIAGTGPTFRYAVEIDESAEPIKITVPIPDGSASVSGEIRTESGQPRLLFNDDMTVIAYINTGKGHYHITGLPPGRYKIGHSVLPAYTHLCEFELGQGQHRVIDWDGDQWQIDTGLLLLHVVDGDGRFLPHARAWLENEQGDWDPWSRGSTAFGLFVPTGRYTLNVQCDGYAPHREEMILESMQIGKTPHTPRIVRLASSR